MSFIISAFMFIAGIVMVNTERGRLALPGFCGYVLCAAAFFVFLLTVCIIIVLKAEEKKQ